MAVGVFGVLGVNVLLEVVTLLWKEDHASVTILLLQMGGQHVLAMLLAPVTVPALMASGVAGVRGALVLLVDAVDLEKKHDHASVTILLLQMVVGHVLVVQQNIKLVLYPV